MMTVMIVEVMDEVMLILGLVVMIERMVLMMGDDCSGDCGCVGDDSVDDVVNNFGGCNNSGDV